MFFKLFSVNLTELETKSTADQLTTRAHWACTATQFYNRAKDSLTFLCMRDQSNPHTFVLLGLSWQENQPMWEPARAFEVHAQLLLVGFELRFQQEQPYKTQASPSYLRDDASQHEIVIGTGRIKASCFAAQ